jgi:hypothetical protein
MYICVCVHIPLLAETFCIESQMSRDVDMYTASVCIYTCVYVYAYKVRVRTCLDVFHVGPFKLHAYTQAHRHTYINTHTHTYTYAAQCMGSWPLEQKRV